MESMKAELVEVSQSWESREKGLRDELEQSNKRLEDQLADSQEQLLTLTQEASELRTELDKVRRRCKLQSFWWCVACCCLWHRLPGGCRRNWTWCDKTTSSAVVLGDVLFAGVCVNVFLWYTTQTSCRKAVKRPPAQLRSW